MAGHQRDHHHHDDLPQREAAVLERLRAGGGRLTPGRRAVVRALLGGPDHHVTADDVAAAVQGQHPELHLSTIYRSLEALESVGVVGRVHLGTDGAAVFHLTDHVHHHLCCDACGAVIEVASDLLDDVHRRVALEHGFRLAPPPISLRGRCRDCPPPS